MADALSELKFQQDRMPPLPMEAEVAELQSLGCDGRRVHRGTECGSIGGCGPRVIWCSYSPACARVQPQRRRSRRRSRIEANTFRWCKER